MKTDSQQGLSLAEALERAEPVQSALGPVVRVARSRPEGRYLAVQVGGRVFVRAPGRWLTPEEVPASVFWEAF